MVEGRHQLDRLGVQEAVPEHVAGHVADADGGEGVGARVEADLAEVAVHRRPRAARGDALALVVVAGRAARGEGVAQPEAHLGGDAVGDVRERGGALVRRDDQVRVGAVVDHEPRGVLDGVADDVVGQAEQRADEGAVLLLDERAQRLALARGALEDEAALAADRHDHRVLGHLGLHQAQDLGPEVVGAIGPAQAAAGDAAAAQVRPLDVRAGHADLEHRARVGHRAHLGRVELEGDPRVPLVVVAAHRRADQVGQASEHLVLGERGDVAERVDERLVGGGLGRRAVALELGVEARREPRHERARHLGVGEQRLVDEAPADDRVELREVHLVRPQQRHLADREPAVQHQAAEPVVLGLAAQDGFGRLDQPRAVRAHVDRVPGRVLDLEDVDAQPGAGGAHGVGDLLQDAEPEVLEDRQHVGERQAAVLVVHAHERHVLAAEVVDRLHQVDVDPALGEGLEMLDVADRRGRAGVGAVAGAEGGRVALRQAPPVALAVRGDEPRAQVVVPRAGQFADVALERLEVDVGQLPVGAQEEVEANERLVLAHGELVVDVAGGEGAHQVGLDPLPHLAVEAVARQAHHDREARGRADRGAPARARRARARGP